MGTIRTGQAFLILCCIFYLIWWGVAFHPSHGDNHTSGKDGILLLITAVLGLVGLAITLVGMTRAPLKNGFVSGIVIIITGIAMYIVLLLASRILLHRQVTSELFLTIGWSMLEIAAMNASFSYEAVTLMGVKLFIAVVIAAAILSLFFYLRYYEVKPRLAIYMA